MTESKYVIQRTSKSHCPDCDDDVDLLAPEEIETEQAYFYICWTCKEVFQTGVGRVPREVSKGE